MDNSVLDNIIKKCWLETTGLHVETTNLDILTKSDSLYIASVVFTGEKKGSMTIAMEEKLANPDLIFTDWYMDEMDGLELIKQIRGHKNTVKICMITSEANDERKSLALNAGADYILNKPIKLNELAKAFEQLAG